MPFWQKGVLLFVVLATCVRSLVLYVKAQRSGIANVTNKRIDNEPRFLLRQSDPEAFRKHQRLNLILILVLFGSFFLIALAA